MRKPQQNKKTKTKPKTEPTKSKWTKPQKYLQTAMLFIDMLCVPQTVIQFL